MMVVVMVVVVTVIVELRLLLFLLLLGVQLVYEDLAEGRLHEEVVEADHVR